MMITKDPSFRLLLLLVFIIVISQAEAISWADSGSVRWSFDCDFPSSDLKSQSSRGEDCGPLCQSNSPCTHFTWTNYQDGTCWMKSGGASESQAVVKTDSNAVCGFLLKSGSFSWTNSDNVRWSFNCDFPGGDFRSAQSSGENCGSLCQSNSPCSHFTWTNYLGGTCWMKSGAVSESNALLKTDSQAVCGFLKTSSGGGTGGNSVSTKATFWAEKSDAGGCQLPAADYEVTDALALGQDPGLQYLVWKSGLCGQVLRVDCGNGAVDAVVASTCNLNSPSCGVDLIGKTWRRATGGQTPGISQCTVSLQGRNPIRGSGSPLCFHRPNSDIGNAYSVIVGVLNTGGRLSSSAWIAGVQGTRGNDGWFIFNSGGRPLFPSDATVEFKFEDGASSSFRLGDCASGGNSHIFQ